MHYDLFKLPPPDLTTATSLLSKALQDAHSLGVPF
jgi:hypothetical protein